MSDSLIGLILELVLKGGLDIFLPYETNSKDQENRKQRGLGIRVPRRGWRANSTRGSPNDVSAPLQRPTTPVENEERTAKPSQTD